MKLIVSKRAAESKGENKKFRRAGMIPAVLYSGGQVGENIVISNSEFQKCLNQIKKGHLSTSKFTLVDENGKERLAIVKDIQYHPTTYNILHLDFEELHKDVTVNVKVPIECVGLVDCVGIKLGGALRQVLRHVKVNCFPKDMPSSFPLDIASLGIKDSKRLKDISFGTGVRPIANLNEVAIAIVKR